MPETPEDELARMIARADQVSADCRGIAGVLGSFFRDLLTQGFERAEAIDLTRDYFSAALDRAVED